MRSFPLINLCEGSEMDEYVTYAADDEEPKCSRCDNMDFSEEQCEKYCGAQHGWCRYSRTEKKED